MTVPRAIRTAAILILVVVIPALHPAPPRGAAPTGPHVLLISIDTLRADRMSSYGYERPTSPNLDRLLAGGVRFGRARVVEPLTNPSMCSTITSLPPHLHGATRNGLRLFKGLDSLPRTLGAHGYRTVAFVGNWTLKDKLSGLGDHFDQYEEILNRKRWFGFIRGEATAGDLSDAALAWMARHAEERPSEPAFMWVHYVEPHAPYKFQDDFAERLGLDPDKKPKPSDRYDTEVAYVDHEIGRLLDGLEDVISSENLLVVFMSDHGESLGEHNYWGHGRNLYEPTLWIPMGLTWKGAVEPRVVSEPSLNTDLAPTVLGLIGIDAPESFQGFNWSGVLMGGDPPERRVTRYQAHKGAVMSKHESDMARENGLLAIAQIQGERKEIWRVNGKSHEIFDLTADSAELVNLAAGNEAASDNLMGWVREIYAGLTRPGDEAPQALDDESIEKLRALGYLD
jgi:arylsulfatase A-like enzyme